MMLLFTACQGNTYKIKGDGSGIEDGDTLYLTDDFETGEPFATAVVEDGKFRFEGYTDSTTFCLLYNASRNDINISLFLEPGTIRVDLSDEPGMSRVTGTKTNKKWQVLNDTLMAIGTEYNTLAATLYGMGSASSATEIQEVQKKIEELNERFKAYVVECAEKNYKNEFGFFIITYYENVIEPEKRLELIRKMPEKMRQRPAIVELEERLSRLTATAVGGTMPQFRMNDMEGNEVDLTAEYAKHELTLIDFWASWCGPCRRDMPGVVELYGAYKDKGLGIIGISLDSDSLAWQSAVEQLGMQWLQVSDLQGWENAMAEACGIEAIPSTIIVDKKGVIVARDLRGTKLYEFIEEKLGPSDTGEAKGE